MIKKLKLFYGCGRFTDNGEYIKADNENLIIKIVTEFGSNVNLYASISNVANSTNYEHFATFEALSVAVSQV